MTRLLASLALAFLAACGGPTPGELKDQSQTALGAGDYPKALALADQGLAAPGVREDRALTWHFERVRLEALAGQGKAAEVLADLTRLSASFGEQIRADLYAKLGKSVNDAGQTSAAIDIVEAGKQRFPDMEVAFNDIVEQIKARAAESGDEEAISKLKSLGYL